MFLGGAKLLGTPSLGCRRSKARCGSGIGRLTRMQARKPTYLVVRGEGQASFLLERQVRNQPLGGIAKTTDISSAITLHIRPQARRQTWKVNGVSIFPRAEQAQIFEPTGSSWRLSSSRHRMPQIAKILAGIWLLGHLVV